MSEHESAAPIPGLRAMAVVRWIMLVATILLSAGTFWHHFRTARVHSSEAARFYCPMHPQIRAPNAGTCPICYMNLEPIPEGRTGTGPVTDADAGVVPTIVPGSSPDGVMPIMLTLERRQAVGIATIAATERSSARELRLASVVEAPQSAVSEVRTRTAGFVEHVAAIETGQPVRAGQALVSIYSPEMLKAQEELLAAARLRQSELGRAQDAGHEHSELGGQVIEAAKRRLYLLGLGPSDVARILAAGRSERTFSLGARKSGIVTMRQVSVGSYATPEMMLFQITDFSQVWVTATVPTDEVSLLVPGTRGRFTSRRGESIEVEALLPEPSVSAETRSARVRFSARNQTQGLRPGDIGEIVLSLPARPYVWVPRDAVIDVGRAQYVFVEKTPGVFTPVAVKLGPLVGDERALLAGLAAGSVVVSRGAFLLDSESRLQAALAPPQRDAGTAEDGHVHGHGESP